MMFPRRSDCSKVVGLTIVLAIGLLVLLRINKPSVTPDAIKWNESRKTVELASSVNLKSIDSMKSKDNDASAVEVYNSMNYVLPKGVEKNASHPLEAFRANMTLGGVNMTGVFDIIKKTNETQQIDVFHTVEEHRNAVNPHPFKYLINAPYVCRKQNVFLIIYIHTAPNHYKRRMVIRQTWGNQKYYPDTTIRLVFVMGSSDDKNSSGSDEGLRFESEQYNDIVQENFDDTYRNLTYKGIAALRWIDKYCSNAKFVLKTDDDIFVNMFTLLKHIKSVEKHEKESIKNSFILCLVWRRMKVMRSGKWRVDEKDWKDDYYPVYCSGSAFIMPVAVAQRLHEVSYHVPFFWVDDFYITGLLPLKAGNITHLQFMSTYVLDGRKLEERFNGQQWFTYIFSHVHNLNSIQSVWEQLVRLESGQERVKVEFALPGSLPDEAELRRKIEEEEKKKIEEQRAKQKQEKAP